MNKIKRFLKADAQLNMGQLLGLSSCAVIAWFFFGFFSAHRYYKVNEKITITESITLMEYSYFKGQHDVLLGNLRIDNTFSEDLKDFYWVESPWQSDQMPTYLGTETELHKTIEGFIPFKK